MTKDEKSRGYWSAQERADILRHVKRLIKKSTNEDVISELQGVQHWIEQRTARFNRRAGGLGK